MGGIRELGVGIRTTDATANPGSRIPSPGSRVASPDYDWDALVLVGRIARPHGLRGEVIVTPETDFVEERFKAGASFRVRSAHGDEQLVVGAARVQSGRPVIAFDGFHRIEDCERLVGLELRVPEESLMPLADGAYYHHQLVGCVVETVAGVQVGEVIRVDGGAGASVLSVGGSSGEVLVPLAADICVEVDVAGRRIRIQPPEGLLELNVRSETAGVQPARKGT